MGNLIARANVSSITYSQAGTYTCTAERPSEVAVEKTLIVTVQCGKIEFLLKIVIPTVIRWIEYTTFEC